MCYAVGRDSHRGADSAFRQRAGGRASGDGSGTCADMCRACVVRAGDRRRRGRAADPGRAERTPLLSRRSGRGAGRGLAPRHRLRIDEHGVWDWLRRGVCRGLDALAAGRPSRLLDVCLGRAGAAYPRRRAPRARPSALVRRRAERARSGLFPRGGVRRRLVCVGCPLPGSGPDRARRGVRVDDAACRRRGGGSVRRRERLPGCGSDRRVGGRA